MNQMSQDPEGLQKSEIFLSHQRGKLFFTQFKFSAYFMYSVSTNIRNPHMEFYLPKCLDSNRLSILYKIILLIEIFLKKCYMQNLHTHLLINNKDKCWESQPCMLAEAKENFVSVRGRDPCFVPSLPYVNVLYLMILKVTPQKHSRVFQKGSSGRVLSP